jgi:cytochrome P450
VYEDHLMAVAQQLGRSMARADDFFTNDQIINEIWTALVNTKLVIADCTQRNLNVFYEIGLAHAIGKPTILIAQSSDDIPFDLRHRRFLQYKFTPRGMKSFEQALERTIDTVLAEASAEV